MRTNELLSIFFCCAITAAGIVACSSDDATPPSPTTDAGGGGTDSGSGGTDSGGGGTDSGGGGTDSGGTAKTDAGVDAGPTSPATARTITVADSVSGTAPGGDDAGHWFKYVPPQAFSSVSINVTVFGTEATLGTMRWQTSTTLGLCNIMGGVVCCNNGPASCSLTITDAGGGPVVVGQTYWIIVLGGNAGQTTSYAFNLVENP